MRCARARTDTTDYRFTRNSSEQGKLQKLWPQIGFASGHTIGTTVYRLDLRPPSEAALSVKVAHPLIMRAIAAAKKKTIRSTPARSSTA
jgi:hypothetical protein